MNNRESDVLYCGVNEEKIKTAKPKLNEEVLKYHHLYITERTEIYKKKEIDKLPQPWTEDEVLLNYRFTNTRRELDRESKYLIENVSKNEKFTLEEKILWSILFRTFNKSETFRRLDLLNILDIKNISDSVIDTTRDLINKEIEKDPKYVWYTPAFNTGGLKASWVLPEQRLYECTNSDTELNVLERDTGVFHKRMPWKEAKSYTRGSPYVIEGIEECIPVRMIHLIKWVSEGDLVQRIIESKDQIDCYKIIMEVPGFANFLSYQIFVDLTYIPEFKFSENEFTISGPGCMRGIDELFEDRGGMTHDEAIFWVRDNIEKEWDKRGMNVDFDTLFNFLPEYDRCLNVMLLENSFCELQKLTKAKRGTGRPRNKYKPTDKPETASLDKW